MSQQIHHLNNEFYKTINKNEYIILREGQSFVFGENNQLLKKTTGPKSLRKRYEIINHEKLPTNKNVIEKDGKLVVEDKPKTLKNGMTNQSTRQPQVAPPIPGIPPIVQMNVC